jgi:hypothetical protein
MMMQRWIVGNVAHALGAAVLLSLLAPAAHSDEAASPQAARLFETQIAPLLSRRCLECHRGGAKKGGLDLSHKEAALAGGENGMAIVPGKADESLLWLYVESDDMPKGRAPLSDQEKQLLRQWIDAGAAWTRDQIGPTGGAQHSAAGDWVRRLTVPEYIETVRSTVGVDIEQEARQLLPPDLRADGFTNTAYSLGIDLSHVEAYARLAAIIVNRMDVEKFASQYSSRRELAEPALREVILGMGKWLLRGPLEEHEVAAYLRVANAVAAQGGDYREGVSYIVEAMLQSPRFIYRIEKQAGETTSRRAGGFELASRMSYILWGAPPDKELLRAAEAGEFADRGKVEAQVKRMLEDPRAVEQSSQFIAEWLDLDRLANLRPSPDRFPHWSSRLAGDMREETIAYFRHLAWEEKRPLADLLNAQVTFVTPRLAEHYGLDPKGGGAQASNNQAASPARIVGGLQALYLFQENGGDTVHNVAGTGDPLDLKIADLSAVGWSEQGLAVNSATLIATAAPPQRLIEAVKNSKAITLEAWITPASTSQTGPARIVTLSADTGQRNFTLGQEGDKIEARLRTTKSTENGMPSLLSPPFPVTRGSVGTQAAHVVYTRDAAGKTKLYINGEEKGAGNAAGDLSNWNGGYRLAVANEVSRDRPWLGTLHLVAVYDRALAADEVRKNRAAGPRAEGAAPESELAFEIANRKDLQALYRFEEGSGDTVRDLSGAGEPLNLKIQNAAAVTWQRGGMTVKSPTLISAAAPPRRFIDAVKKSKAVTLEAWITPANVDQSGPARILTLSGGILARNFTLGQDGDKYDVRFRASNTDASGLPSLSSPSGAVQTRLTHVVYTRDAAGKAKLYINGQEKAARDVVGDLANWDGGFQLALANETSSDRPWLGTYHQVAIYSRALPADEVRANSTPRSAAAVVARYDLSSTPGRGGLLTQGSVLTVGGDEASMVTRGLFVLHELLYDKVDDPPPCVDTTPVPTKPGLTQRAVAESRIADASCRGCHAKFEPLAFGLEKFDGLGAYHEADEHGNRLREDGEVLFPGQEKPVAYKTSAELMDLLAGSDRVRRAITRRVTQFALGRPLLESDQPVLDKIHQAAQSGGGTYASLITAVVLSDLVQTTPAESAPAAGSAPPPSPEPAKGPQRVAAGLLAHFTFQEGSGNTVRDVSGAGEPLVLKIADPAAVRWSGEGLVIESSTLIASEQPPRRLIDAVRKSKAVTLEAWITPADPRQSGPARILTLSSGSGARNFTLGQDSDKFDVRFRSTRRDVNGLPSLASPGGSAAPRQTHVVYTRDAAGKAKLYIDGKEVAAGEVGGDLSNWDQNFRLALANETTKDRPWRGVLRRIASSFSEGISDEELLDATDALGEAGCDDCSVGVHDHGLELEFDRSHQSLQEAIISAIRDVESAGFVVESIRMDRDAVLPVGSN